MSDFTWVECIYCNTDYPSNILGGHRCLDAAKKNLVPDARSARAWARALAATETGNIGARLSQSEDQARRAAIAERNEKVRLHREAIEAERAEQLRQRDAVMAAATDKIEADPRTAPELTRDARRRDAVRTTV